jgi:hypothetical protein
MNLKDILDRSFYKEEVQNLCWTLGLQTTGDKDELVGRVLRYFRKERTPKEIKEGKSAVIDVIGRLNKDMLQLACEDTGLDSFGTKDQLLRRVIKNIEWPTATKKAASDTEMETQHPKQTTLDESHIAESAPPEGFAEEGPAKVKAEQPFNFKNFLIRYFDKDTLKTLAERTGYKVSGSKESVAERIVQIFQKLPDDDVGTFLNRLYWYLGDWRKACKALGISDSGSKMSAVFRLFREIPEVSSRMKPEHRDEIGLRIGEKPSDMPGEVASKGGLLSRISGFFSEPEPRKRMRKVAVQKLRAEESGHPKAGLVSDETMPASLADQHIVELPQAQAYVLSPSARELSIDENQHALFRRVVCEIQKWTPEESYKSEETYKYSLNNYLKNLGYATRTEAGEELVDILVDGQIPIEIKKRPKSRSDYDRFAYQLLRFADVHRCSIGVICDMRGEEGFRDFFDRLIRIKGDRKITIITL